MNNMSRYISFTIMIIHFFIAQPAFFASIQVGVSTHLCPEAAYNLQVLNTSTNFEIDTKYLSEEEILSDPSLDVLILSRVSNFVHTTKLDEHILDFVYQGGGLILTSVLQTYSETPLTAIIPLNTSSQYAFCIWGTTSFYMKVRTELNHPVVDGLDFINIDTVVAGCATAGFNPGLNITILADLYPNDSVCSPAWKASSTCNQQSILTTTYGSGRIVMLGFSYCNVVPTDLPQGGQHHRLLENAIFWAAGEPNATRIYSPTTSTTTGGSSDTVTTGSSDTVTTGSNGTVTTGSTVLTTSGTTGSSSVETSQSGTLGNTIADEKGDGLHPGAIAAIVISILAVVCAALFIFFFVHYRRLRSSQPEKPDLEVVPNVPRKSIVGVQLIPTEDISIIVRIGAGNFGEVFKGKWHSTFVALKKLKQLESADEDMKKELVLMSKLSHPNILSLLGIWESPDKEHFIVTEYMSKGSCSQLLQQYRNSIPIGRLYEVATGVAAGMAYLEQKHILHRDLSCRNILIKEEEGAWIAKVSDFGLSRQTSENIYTVATEQKLPVRWTAPETFKRGEFSVKSDVFAYGVTVWEIFSYGDLPFPEYDNASVRLHVVAGQRLPCPSDCPPDVYEMMLRCWDEDTSKRPTFKELNAFFGSYYDPQMFQGQRTEEKHYEDFEVYN